MVLVSLSGNSLNRAVVLQPMGVAVDRGSARPLGPSPGKISTR